MSVEQDLGRSIKRQWAWRFPPELSWKVAQDSATSGSPRPLVACLGRQQGRTAEGWPPMWRKVNIPSEAEPQEAPHGPRCLLWPYNPESIPSHLISQAKQDWAWLVLGWETT